MMCPKCDSSKWFKLGTIVECGSCGFRLEENHNFHYFNKAKYIK